MQPQTTTSKVPLGGDTDVLANLDVNAWKENLDRAREVDYVSHTFIHLTGYLLPDHTLDLALVLFALAFKLGLKALMWMPESEGDYE